MIAAVLLAAGRSTRMGGPKMCLPWKGGRSVIASVVEVFERSGASPIVVVTGADREAVEEALNGMDVWLTFNPDFSSGEMLSSIKVGLQILEGTEVQAVMITPGDLPLVRQDTLEAMIDSWRSDPCLILAPSHKGGRGHPVLVARKEWPAIQALKHEQSLRTFLRQRQDEIRYLSVDDPGVMRDIDTPEEYQAAVTE
jgi:molybdenum cofactor cytidylyltransferase